MEPRLTTVLTHLGGNITAIAGCGSEDAFIEFVVQLRGKSIHWKMPKQEFDFMTPGEVAAMEEKYAYNILTAVLA